MDRWLSFNAKFKDGRKKIKKLIQIIYGEILTFCHVYHLSPEDLISWIHGSEDLKVSNSIDAFLTELPRRTNTICPKDSCFFSFCPFNHQIITDNLSVREVPFIVFIDGDNTSWDTLSDIPPPEEYVEILIFKMPRNLPNPNLSIISTQSMVKDAADTVMTLKVGELHLKLRLNIEFILVTADHFVRELMLQIGKSRICHHIDPHLYNLGYKLNKIICSRYPELKVRRKESLFYTVYKSLGEGLDLPQIRSLCNHHGINFKNMVNFLQQKGKKFEILPNIEIYLASILVEVKKLLNSTLEINLAELGQQISLPREIKSKYVSWGKILK